MHNNTQTKHILNNSTCNFPVHPCRSRELSVLAHLRIRVALKIATKLLAIAHKQAPGDASHVRDLGFCLLASICGAAQAASVRSHHVALLEGGIGEEPKDRELAHVTDCYEYAPVGYGAAALQALGCPFQLQAGGAREGAFEPAFFFLLGLAQVLPQLRDGGSRRITGVRSFRRRSRRRRAREELLGDVIAPRAPRPSEGRRARGLLLLTRRSAPRSSSSGPAWSPQVFLQSAARARARWHGVFRERGRGLRGTGCSLKWLGDRRRRKRRRFASRCGCFS
jgi:hypothetical protein